MTVPVPPYCEIAVAGYGVPTFPEGSDEVRMAIGAAIVIDSVFVAVCAGEPESVAVTVKLRVPAGRGAADAAGRAVEGEPGRAASPAARST